MILIKTIYIITKSLEWIEKKKKSDSNTLRTFQLKSAQVYIPKTTIDSTQNAKENFKVLLTILNNVREWNVFSFVIKSAKEILSLALNIL